MCNVIKPRRSCYRLYPLLPQPHRRHARHLLFSSSHRSPSRRWRCCNGTRSRYTTGQPRHNTCRCARYRPITLADLLAYLLPSNGTRCTYSCLYA